mgnify:FL=1
MLNKIDLPGADPERVRKEIEEVRGSTHYICLDIGIPYRFIDI